MKKIKLKPAWQWFCPYCQAHNFVDLGAESVVMCDSCEKEFKPSYPAKFPEQKP